MATSIISTARDSSPNCERAAFCARCQTLLMAACTVLSIHSWPEENFTFQQRSEGEVIGISLVPYWCFWRPYPAARNGGVRSVNAQLQKRLQSDESPCHSPKAYAFESFKELTLMDMMTPS
jgi:hypothetical protein